ncbi:MAG: translation initiation factor IF-2 [Deltaproteobacteria bacterium]|nr:translation initiation factor IF-2 [Deltaproteobacteria bacterium]
MPKFRVYEIARQMGLSNKDLVAKIQSLGIQVKNHMSTLTSDEVQAIKAALERERQESTVEKRIGSTVIRRRSKVKRWTTAKPTIPAAPTPEAAKPAEPEHEPNVQSEDQAKESTVHADEAEVTATESLPATDQVVKPAAAPQPLSERETEQEPAVEATEASTAAPPVDQARGEQTEAPAEQASDQQQQPAMSQEEKLGPTGRRIELSQFKTPKVIITDLGESRAGYRPRGERPQWTRRQPTGRTQYQKGRRKVTTKKAKQTLITTPAEHKRRVRMEGAISVVDMARQMGIKATDALKKLWAMGMKGVTINTSLDEDTATLLAAEFSFDIENVAFQEETLIQTMESNPEDLEPRSPVITIMGHVDHGKTSLLDRIRHSDITASEAGGITQHIGAYKVATPKGTLVFLDTPGHEAFTQMRARGAQSTDIVVLVVAADDGIMPQTKEAIQHAQSAKVPIVVAINKIDKADAEPQKVRQQLTEFGLVAEEWGGDTLMIEVSAANGTGIDQLLDTILLQAEILELKANPKKPGRGLVIEAMLDRARGPVTTILVQDGTLQGGDVVVAGEFYGKIRAITDERGHKLAKAGPATPIRIMGLDGVPEGGEAFYVLKDEKKARQLVSHRRDEKRKKELAETSASAIRLERIAEMIRDGEQHELGIVLKADVQGTAQAVKEAVLKLSTDKVKTVVMLSGVGGITETDVTFAKAAGAFIIGFNVRPAGKAAQLAEQEKVEIRLYTVIYELLDDMKEAMRGLLPKEQREKVVGQIDIRQTFNIPKVGTVAGCFVQSGKILRSSKVRLYRENVKIYEGKLGSLKRFTEDVREVEKDYECGLSIENFNDIKVGDIIEVYEVEELAPEL